MAKTPAPTAPEPTPAPGPAFPPEPEPAPEHGPTAIPADIAALSYEAARDELAAIVSALESGTAGLEQSMTLWQRGQALAAHCESWLDAAQAKLEQ